MHFLRLCLGSALMMEGRHWICASIQKSFLGDQPQSIRPGLLILGQLGRQGEGFWWKCLRKAQPVSVFSRGRSFPVGLVQDVTVLLEN